MGQPSYLKSSCRKTKTRGTETSKYPEEEKTISDSASSGERTRKSPNLKAYVLGGCRTAVRLFDQMEVVWKTTPQRVKVPYMQIQIAKQYPE